ncbi:hypothetical protein LTR94_031243, partial [Friedmanniomyces endolithicus]
LSPVTKQGPIYAGGIALLQGALLLSGCGGPDLSETNDATAVNVATDATPIPAGSQAPVAGPKRVVLAFGDSLYAGYGLSRGQSLPDAIQARLRAHGINATIVKTKARQYEIGLKASFGPHYLYATGFYTKFNPFNASFAAFNPLTGRNDQVLPFIGEASVKGVEVDGRVAPARWFSITG